LSAQQILSIYQKRWPIEVDNFYTYCIFRHNLRGSRHLRVR
jgi:hypothetical protein